MNLKELSLNQSVGPPVGGSASPFIDEGDDFTGERERVHMLLSLVAHADEGWIMVGGHCRMSGAHRRLRCLLQEGLTSVPAKNIVCLEACEEIHHVHRVW